MPSVQIDMVEGRSLEQKREMAEKVTKAIVESAKCPPEAVAIVIREWPKSNFAKCGKLLCD